MKVRLADEARADLRAIRDYIAADDPRRALSLVRELYRRCLTLSKFPARFPLLSRYEWSGVRHFAHGKYLIFYRIEVTQVVVLHCVHGARDYSALLFPD